LLVASFLGLTLSSLSYAIIGGEVYVARAAVEHSIAGLGFASSALILLLAILQIVGSASVSVQSMTRTVVGTATPVLSFVYITTGVYDAAAATGRASSRVLLTFAVLGALSLIAARLMLLPRKKPARGDKRKAYARLAGVSVSLTVICAVSIPIVSLASRSNENALFWPVWLVIPLAGLGASGFIIFVRTMEGKAEETVEGQTPDIRSASLPVEEGT
jgi:hypothetical protein